MQIQFLTGRIVKNPQPDSGLDSYIWKSKLYPSWSKLPKKFKKIYSEYSCLFIQALACNKILEEKILEFRELIGISADGIDCIKNYQLIRSLKKGPMFLFDKVIPKGKYRLAEQYIKKFLNIYTVPHPLKVHIRTIFYAGFVNLFEADFDRLTCEIPVLPKKVEGTILQYRPPVCIKINSRDITRENIKDLIDEKWPEICAYFRAYPFVADSEELSLKKLRVFALAQEGHTAREIRQILKKSGEHRDMSEAAVRKNISRFRENIQQFIKPSKKM